MTIPSAEYVEALLTRADPNSDFIVTSEPDGLYIEVYADSCTLHCTITDEHSVMLAVLEQLTKADPGTAP